MRNVTPFRSNRGVVGRVGAARVFMHEYDECFALQIEMENDHAVTLVYSRDDGKISVTTWRGDGEAELGDCGLEHFKEFAEIATGTRPWRG